MLARSARSNTCQRQLTTVLLVDLQQIVERYAEAIERVDATVQTSSANTTRTGEVYQVGFKSMNEEPALEAIDQAWEILHPGERWVHRLGVRYPNLPSTAKVDHVITTDGPGHDRDEWGIEVKRLQFVGDNGKRGDYETTKVLSPYLKDRGMLHDAVRLRQHGFTRRIAIVGYSFDYDSATLSEAKARHSSVQAVATIKEIERVVRINGPLRIRPLMEFADAILGLRGFSAGPRAQAEFEAWRHPAGGQGVVFGWEVRRPWLEVDYDERHPW
jgi:hypothetical protein